MEHRISVKRELRKIGQLPERLFLYLYFTRFCYPLDKVPLTVDKALGVYRLVCRRFQLELLDELCSFHLEHIPGL